MDYRSYDRIAADEYCSAIEFNRRFGMEGSTVMSRFLGLHQQDLNWVAPDGRDCTELCNRSAIGSFGGHGWTIGGWILDADSMAELRAEFPEEFVNR